MTRTRNKNLIIFSTCFVMFSNGKYARQAQLVQENEAAIVPDNTVIAYKSKGQEFLHFCHQVYKSTSNNAVSVVTVTEEKVFALIIFYLLSQYLKHINFKNSLLNCIKQ